MKKIKIFVDTGADVSYELAKEYGKYYLDYVDYTNAFSKLGVKAGNLAEKTIKYIIKKSLKILSDLFYE